jgi:hypothetical protein
MKQKLPWIAEMVYSISVSITNHTQADIHVRVTTTGVGSQYYYDLPPGSSESWIRSEWQVAFILRDDTGATETLVVKPGNTYTVS